MKKLAWHFDFHSHESVRIGHDPDPIGIASALAEAGVEEIISFAKCHTGFSYYPTKIGIEHPKMQGDPFGDIVDACRAQGVKVLAYVSFGIDGEIARRHPGWRQFQRPGEAMDNEDHFICVCPFTPYLDDYFLPQVKEIIERYEPAGFFFDTMSAFNPCYCELCQQVYAEVDGDLPTADEPERMGTFGQWRHDRAIELIGRVGDFITDLLPAAEIGFNQIGSPPYPEAMPESIRRLTLDFQTSKDQSRQSSLCANYGATASREADIMPTRFNEGWGDWSPAPDLALQQVAAPVLAYRQRLYMGDRCHPANKITAGTRHALRLMADLWEAMAEVMPDDDVPFAPDTIVAHCPSSVYGEDMRDFSIDARDKLNRLFGAHRLLLDTGRNIAIAAETYLADWLDPARLLIIPEQPALSRAAEEHVLAFLEAGGQALITGRVPRVDGKPVDWLGVEEGPPWQDHLWLPWLATDDHPVLVRGDSHVLQPIGAEGIVFPLAPYDLKHGVQMGWGINPPADEPAKHPILTRAQVGKGSAWFLGCPLFADYACGINFQQKKWLEALLRMIQPRPLQRLDSPTGSVELVPYRDRSTTWSVLLNHGGEEFSPYGSMPWPRTVGPLPAYPLTLIVRDPEQRTPTEVTVGGESCEWERLDDEIHVPLVLDTVWDIVIIHWE